MDWIVTHYKQDGRCKDGKRYYRTFDLKGVGDALTSKDVIEMLDKVAKRINPKTKDIYEVRPATIMVKNLMTGKMVEIASDTPWCCRPDSETFWSN